MAGRSIQLCAVALSAWTLTACSGQKSGPESLPPQSVSQATLEDSEFEEYVVAQEETPAVETPEPSEPPASAVEEVEKESSPSAEEAIVADDLRLEEDDSVIVIEDGTETEAESGASLVETARAERRRRGITQKSDIVITDKNLAEFATGQLTVSDGVSITNESLGAPREEIEEPEDGETYWRERGYGIRLAWKEATERVEELEEDVFNLRMRFYAEDDPFFRDGQIKPAWDHAIEELNRARDEVEARQQELADFMEEGRLAGALPGWLREGIELEPESPDDEEIGIVEPGEPETMEGAVIEPPIAEDPGGGGR